MNGVSYPQSTAMKAKSAIACLTQFADKFADDALVMDKYFALIASSRRKDTLQQVQTALNHPKFSIENPNKARSLLISFSRNIPHFHAEDGSGYRFVADKVMEIDRFNPQVAAPTGAGF